MILDLNAKRAARAAVRGDGMQMILGTQTFQLVDDLPIEIGELANNNKIGEALRMMLANPDEDWDRLRSCRPSFQDVLDVVEYFGTALGESARSTEPSTNTGPRSRPTLTATTDETLPASVTELRPLEPVASSASSETFHPTPPTDVS